MNYRHPELRAALSAEYVLGTLRGPARRRFERLLHEDFVLRESVRQWQNDLYPTLLEVLPEQQPPVRVWQEITQATISSPKSLRPKPKSIQPAGLWHNLPFWRVWAVMVTLMLVLLSWYSVMNRLSIPPAAEPDFIAVLEDQVSKPAWLVHIDRNRHKLQITTLGLQPHPPDRRHNFWLIPPRPGQAPIALGQLPASGTILLPLAQAALPVLSAGVVLAATLEPSEGSLSGESIGPVMYQGELIAP